MTLYRKTQLIEVISFDEEKGYLVQNAGNPEDQWYINKPLFESSYEEAIPTLPEGQFDYGMAIKVLKTGNRVQRTGWNGKGMWLKFINNYSVVDPDVASLPNAMSGEATLPWIGMKTADGKFVPWLASQTDML